MKAEVKVEVKQEFVGIHPELLKKEKSEEEDEFYRAFNIGSQNPFSEVQ